jgi:quercetin dioxygenase-like cupin family protein
VYLELNKMKNYITIFQDISWESPIPGARFKSFEQDGKRLRLVEFSEELVEPDWCIKGHIGYVLTGEMEINFNGKIVSYKAGDGIFIPSGENHKHMVTVRRGTVRIVLVEEV